jgi:hypothetical protein
LGTDKRPDFSAISVRPTNKGARPMATQREINGAKTYSRHLIALLGKETDATERQEILDELIASVIFLKEALDERNPA